MSSARVKYCVCENGFAIVFEASLWQKFCELILQTPHNQLAKSLYMSTYHNVLPVIHLVYVPLPVWCHLPSLSFQRPITLWMLAEPALIPTPHLHTSRWAPLPPPPSSFWAVLLLSLPTTTTTLPLHHQGHPLTTPWTLSQDGCWDSYPMSTAPSWTFLLLHLVRSLAGEWKEDCT